LPVQGTKRLDFQGPPLPRALVMDLPHRGGSDMECIYFLPPPPPPQQYKVYLLRSNGCSPQSRQSAKRFSSRWNWDSPNPLAAGECAPPPFGPGGGHTRLRLKGWGSPNSNEGTYIVVLYICKYFVVLPLPRTHTNTYTGLSLPPPTHTDTNRPLSEQF
jgi:hypothetical protein